MGLVRAGVAPDHPKIKSVTRVFEKTAKLPGFRFHGNVDVGTDVTHAQLAAAYYAVGTSGDRRLGIEGEDLPGSHAATEFVGWYNGHPDYAEIDFDLSPRRAVVIGNGNVALDVARMLALSVDELAVTEISDHALEALRQSGVEEIVVLGRRSPAQAAFTNPTPIPGVYAAGWIKRGPSGLIGTSKKCAQETNDLLLADHGDGLSPSRGSTLMSCST